MRVTNYMIGKWAKAALLVMFGIILFMYFDRVMNELLPAFERLIEGQAPFLADLLNAIGWILILWCFVDAALNIIMSFRDSKISLDDIGAKLDAIEKKMAEQQMAAASVQSRPLVVEQGGIGMGPVTPATDPRLSPPMPPPPP
jgi:hypothetical protein